MKRIAAILLASMPALALASEQAHEAGHDAHAAHAIPWATLFLSAINLLLFFLMLRRYAWPAIVSAVADRQSRIIESLESAARTKAEAERIKAEWETRLSQLPAELESMRNRARADISAERDQILAQAQKASETIRKEAERAAAQEVRHARDQLREEVARQALATARQLAQQSFTAADHARFLDDFVAKVGK